MPKNIADSWHCGHMSNLRLRHLLRVGNTEYWFEQNIIMYLCLLLKRWALAEIEWRWRDLMLGAGVQAAAVYTDVSRKFNAGNWVNGTPAQIKQLVSVQDVLSFWWQKLTCHLSGSYPFLDVCMTAESLLLMFCDAFCSSLSTSQVWMYQCSS